MNSARVTIIVSLLLALFFAAGCGRKTAPVYSEKVSVDLNVQEKSNNDDEIIFNCQLSPMIINYEAFVMNLSC